MSKIKVLNLYAGIGGNRKLWPNNEIEVTAVEIDPDIAKIYKDFFPNDKVIVGDAHQYLLEHYKEFDFIWSSPPCPTHSKVRFANQIQNKPIYPDMKLYQQILFLKGYFKGKWVVENVVSWYKPLIKPFEVGNHYFWSNFIINKEKFEIRGISRLGETLGSLQKERFDLSHIKSSKIDKRLVLRNCVEPKLALHIFNCAFKEIQKPLVDINKGG